MAQLLLLDRKVRERGGAGTSKHGLGRAVDFQDQLGELAFTSPGYPWLTKNAALFGFTHPESLREGSPNAEAWHWEAH